jgi:hypothetical protein
MNRDRQKYGEKYGVCPKVWFLDVQAQTIAMRCIAMHDRKRAIISQAERHNG